MEEAHMGKLTVNFLISQGCHCLGNASLTRGR